MVSVSKNLTVDESYNRWAQRWVTAQLNTCFLYLPQLAKPNPDQATVNNKPPAAVSEWIWTGIETWESSAMVSPVFYYFQTKSEKMEVESLLKETRKILKRCSRLTKQIASDPSSHLPDILNSEIVKGELLEHKLF